MSNFAIAAELSFNNWVDSLPMDEQFDYSKKHIAYMNRLVDRMRNDKLHRLTRKTIRILLVAAILIAIATVAFANSGSRNAIIRHFNGYAEYVVEHVDSEKVKDINVGYIPDGFELVSEHKSSNSIELKYENSDGDWIYVNKLQVDTNFRYNTEDSNDEIIKINDCDYLVIRDEKYDIIELMWNDGRFINTVRSNLLEEECFKVALSIK